MMTDGLLPQEYTAVVAPALRVAAELAARRGDPYLFNDLTAMLTLMVLVEDLAGLYRERWGPLGQLSSAEVFAEAPLAACVMVLREYDIEPDSVGRMSRAIRAAHGQLTAGGVFGGERELVAKAWRAMLDADPGRGSALLRQAAVIIATAIDAWEAARGTRAAH